LTFAEGGFLNLINEIYEALGESTRVEGATSRDGADTEGKGYEFELTANPTRQWRLTANFAQTRGTQSNNQPRNRGYFLQRRPEWARQGAVPLIAPTASVPSIDPKTGARATIQTALDTAENFLDNILGANGVTRRHLREYTGSFLAAYTFRSDHRHLNGLVLGGAVRYRSEPVVGYTEGREPIHGDSQTYVNAFLRKEVRLSTHRVRLQANFDNVLNVNDPMVVDADVN